MLCEILLEHKFRSPKVRTDTPIIFKGASTLGLIGPNPSSSASPPPAPAGLYSYCVVVVVFWGVLNQIFDDDDLVRWYSHRK